MIGDKKLLLIILNRPKVIEVNVETILAFLNVVNQMKYLNLTYII